MIRTALVRLDLFLVLAAVVVAVDPAHESLPALLAFCLLGTLVVTTVHRRAVLEARVVAAVGAILAFRRVLVPEPATWSVPRRPGGIERGRRSTLLRLQCPDVPGKPRARAPGRA